MRLCNGGIRFRQSRDSHRHHCMLSNFLSLTTPVIWASSERRGRVVWCRFSTSFDGGGLSYETPIMILPFGMRSLKMLHRALPPCLRVLIQRKIQGGSNQMRKVATRTSMPSALATSKDIVMLSFLIQYVFLL